jgi:hypothetical protein
MRLKVAGMIHKSPALPTGAVGGDWGSRREQSAGTGWVSDRGASMWSREAVAVHRFSRRSGGASIESAEGARRRQTAISSNLLRMQERDEEVGRNAPRKRTWRNGRCRWTLKWEGCSPRLAPCHRPMGPRAARPGGRLDRPTNPITPEMNAQLPLTLPKFTNPPRTRAAPATL